MSFKSPCKDTVFGLYPEAKPTDLCGLVEGFHQQVDYFFEVFTVGFIECSQLVAVDVEHAPHFSCGYHRYDDFGTGEGTAGNVPGELIYVGHELGTGFSLGGAAYTASFLDAVAGHAALKRTKVEFAFVYEVEAYPKESEGFFQGGTGVGQHADFVFLAFNQRGELFEELSVSLTLVGKGGFKTCFHMSEFSDIKTGSLPKKRTC